MIGFLQPMTKKKIDFHVSTRDIDLLTALDRCPMTVCQLCRLSETFDTPFTDKDNLRRRLRNFTKADIVQKVLRTQSPAMAALRVTTS